MLHYMLHVTAFADYLKYHFTFCIDLHYMYSSNGVTFCAGNLRSGALIINLYLEHNLVSVSALLK